MKKMKRDGQNFQKIELKIDEMEKLEIKTQN